jgi:hypothetical protein
MAEMTLEQRQAMAMAAARLRMQQASPPVPTEEKQYKLSEVPGAAWEHLGPSAIKFGKGLYEMVASPVQTLSSILDVGAGALRNTLPKGVVDFVDQFDADPAAAARASATASAVGGMYKSRYGDYESIKRTFAEDPVGAAADLSTLLSAGGGAATRVGLTGTGAALSKAGAVINPLQPVGVLAKVGKNLANVPVDIARAVFSPKNALYLRAAEGRAPEIINALRQAQEIVPGSMPTAAQAAAETGVVGFQKLGASAARESETAYRAREAQQAAAQLAQVQRVGRTPRDIAVAEGARAHVTAPMYKAADEILSKVDADFVALQSRPSMDVVMARAAKLAKEKDLPFQIGKTTPETRTPSALVDEAGRPLGETVTPAQYAELPGTSIHFIKQAFDDLIRDPATFGIGKSEARAIAATRADFLKWVDQTTKNPAYDTARATFAKMSEPINQMQVGQFLESKLTPALGEGTAKLRGAGYSAALEAAPATIKKATTGESRFKTLENIFENDPAALDALYAIRDDLARAAKSERLAKGPIKQEFDVARASEVLGGETLIPNLINRVATISNEIWRRLSGKIDKTTAMEVATEMLYPGKAADALAKAYLKQQTSRAISGVINAPFEAFYTTPALVNMLAPKSENALAP